MLHTLFSCLERFNVHNSSAKSKVQERSNKQGTKNGVTATSWLGTIKKEKAHAGTDMVKLS